VLILTDETSFCQDCTSHAAWSPVGHPPEVPVTRKRYSVKILRSDRTLALPLPLPARHCLQCLRLLRLPAAITRRCRRQGAPRIQDNASYHKDAEVWSWARSNRGWLEVPRLLPYSPEFNATERLWQHTRRNGTHNRYFANTTELLGTLARVFTDLQNRPGLIRPYLLPSC